MCLKSACPCLFCQVGKPENVLGWYHSHPGYGCWLSGIDVSTQMTNQQFQDPFLAIVVRRRGRTGQYGGSLNSTTLYYWEQRAIDNMHPTYYWYKIFAVAAPQFSFQVSHCLNVCRHCGCGSHLVVARFVLAQPPTLLLIVQCYLPPSTRFWPCPDCNGGSKGSVRNLILGELSTSKCKIKIFIFIHNVRHG